MEGREYGPLLKKALLEIQDLRSRLEQSGRASTDPIAVIGMGCRFPGGADSPEAYWRILRDEVDVIRDVPADRWNRDARYGPELVSPETIHTRRGGFLDGIDRFDPGFFSLSEAEAAGMDPQQRLLLEVAWETFENAALAPDRVAGSRTAVFVGITNMCDFYRSLVNPPGRSGTGVSNCVAANRLSYVFDLKGPSLALDTACSSSLVAAHLACQSLRLGEAEMALVAGVNAILSPEWMVTFSMAGMISKEGSCKSFDASADGFVRSEGCGAILLKRLADAQRDGDRVLGVVRGTAVNQDGRGSALTVPNGTAQRSVIRAALRSADVAANEISYVEAHGIGSEMGDSIEVSALKAVLSEGRPGHDRCWIGSVKPNIGHSEAAAGLSGLIKTLLALRHESIPPQLHLKTLNPNLAIEDTPFAIPMRSEPWPRGPTRRLACVNSFGIGGTNAHIVLEEPPVPTARTIREQDPPCHAVTLSATSSHALRELAERYGTYLDTHPEVAVKDVALTTTTGRAHFQHRLALIVSNRDSLREQLASFVDGDRSVGTYGRRMPGQDTPRVAFLFGGGVIDTAEGFLANHPTFRQAWDRCAEVFRHQTGTDPRQFAFQYALAEVFRDLGIVPHAVLGHGIGEVVAALVAGVCGIEDGLHLALAGSRGAKPSFNPPSRTWISGTTGKVMSPRHAPDADYWREQFAREPDTNRSIEALVDRGCDHVVVFGTAEVPTDSIRRLNPWGDGAEERWNALLRTLAVLYAHGTDLRWQALQPERHGKIELPTYPFQRIRCWPDSPELRPPSGGPGVKKK